MLRPNAPRNVGLLLVGIGTFAVAVACIQHWNYVRKLSPDHAFRWDVAFIVAILIGLLGILIFASMVYTCWPLRLTPGHEQGKCMELIAIAPRR